MPHLKVDYLYRDASNYKNYGSVIIENNGGMTVEAFRAALKKRFADFQYWGDVIQFQPEVLGWSPLYFDEWIEDDLMLHEISDITETEKAAEFTMPYFLE